MLGNSSEMCVCVCVCVCVAERILLESWGQTAVAEELLSACVTEDKSDSQVY